MLRGLHVTLVVGPLENTHVLPIEVCDGLGPQSHLADAPVARLHDEPVVDEVELDLERARAVGHGTRAQSARAHVQGNVWSVSCVSRHSASGRLGQIFGS